MVQHKNHNGVPDGIDAEGLVKYSFSGSPTSLYEHEPKATEVRSFHITAECTGIGDEVISDGVRRVAKWRVREVTLGVQTTLKGDSAQTTIDDELDAQADPDAVEATERAEAHNVADPFTFHPSKAAAVELAVANNDDSAPDDDPDS